MPEKYGPKQEYQPTPEELAAGDDRLTPTQSAMSRRQTAAFEKKGQVVLRVDDTEPTTADKARWPDAKYVQRLSIMLQDGRKIELVRLAIENAAGRIVPYPVGGKVAGSINGEDVPSDVAADLYRKFESSLTDSDGMYYSDDYAANDEVQKTGKAELWKDLI